MDSDNLLVSILLLVVVAGTIGPFIGPGGAVASSDPKADIGSCVESLEPYDNRTATEKTTTITIHQTTDNRTAKLQIHDPPDDFWLKSPNSIEFIDSEGFDIKLGGKHAAVTSDRDLVWVTVTSARFENNAGPGTAEGNTLVKLPESRYKLHYETNSTGYVGSHFALLGPHERISRTVGCQRIQTVVPKSAKGELRYTPSEILHRLEIASREIAIGHRYATVSAFVAPGSFGPRPGYVVVRRGTRNRGSSEMVLSPNISKREPESVIVHEYVHTRQRNLRPKWVAEGKQAT